ncbi:MAG: Flp pilus assembly complex ATPase component [PVC group bacterium]|nr:Flp pilus assembly complex ATPase component [PVC group bacterium]
MDKKTNTIVTQLLLDRNLLDEKTIQSCFAEAENRKSSPVPFLAQRANLSEAQLLENIANQLHILYLDLKSIPIDDNAIKKVPVKVASYYKFIPVKLENRTLTIAVAYPLDIKKQDAIRTQLGFNIAIGISCEEDIFEMLKKYYGLGAETLEKIIAQKTYESSETKIQAEEQVEDLEALSGTASVIQLVNQIILESYKKRATDIHIEPYRSKIRLRYRIDGILYEANLSPEMKSFLTPILSRIKLMANLNIVERRVPQDGRAVVKVQDETLDLRVSFIPTPYGESVVIRILPTTMLFGLDRLGLAPEEFQSITGLLDKPHGIVFLTGPTGSGKTTTLYACLSCINTNKRKIITIEDPIEYELEGITQIQVTPAVGLSFACGLRSMLRHDPDVMMVGEVRDLETAEIAIRVALTGHLVFSTLHTNDAASGITRLVDVGVEPYLVASSVECFIAQRLVRVICPHCREEITESTDIKEKIARDLGHDHSQEIKLYRGKGCQSCNSTGYYGRTAIYEILILNESIRKLVLQKVSSEDIKRCAVNCGMRTLRQSGWLKVIEGVTTTDEILRVTQADEVSLAEEVEEPVVPAAPAVKKISPEKIKPVKKEIDSIDPADRRVFERLDNRVYVRYTFFKTGQKNAGYEPEQVAVTKNISAGGLLFDTSESLAVGEMVDLTLELPDETSVQCLARVIRVEEIVPNKNYEIAVCFLDLPNVERSRLNRFVLRGD